MIIWCELVAFIRMVNGKRGAKCRTKVRTVILNEPGIASNPDELLGLFQSTHLRQSIPELVREMTVVPRALSSALLWSLTFPMLQRSVGQLIPRTYFLLRFLPTKKLVLEQTSTKWENWLLTAMASPPCTEMKITPKKAHNITRKSNLSIFQM